MNKTSKIIIGGLASAISLTVVGVFLFSRGNVFNGNGVLSLGDSKSRTYDKYNQISPDESGDYDDVIGNGKYISIIYEANSDQQNDVFNSSDYFFVSTAKTSGYPQTYLSFFIDGATTISWSMSATKLYEYSPVTFTLDVYDENTDVIGSSNESLSGSLTSSDIAGKSAWIYFQVSGYAELNISSISFSYDCVGN